MELAGRMLPQISYTENGKMIVSFAVDKRFKEEFENYKDTDVKLAVSHPKAHRSLDANAYAWVLINKISKEMGVPTDMLYKHYVRNVGGASNLVCVQEDKADDFCRKWAKNGLGWQTEKTTSKLDGCVKIIVYAGSSVFDTMQMTTFIDSIIEDAKALGIETMTPAEEARLKDLWEKKHND